MKTGRLFGRPFSVPFSIGAIVSETTAASLFNDVSILERLVFRQFLWRGARATDTTKAANSRRLLRDRELFVSVLSALATEYTLATSKPLNSKRDLQDFFQWLIDNQDEVFKLIQRIIEFIDQFQSDFETALAALAA